MTKTLLAKKERKKQSKYAIMRQLKKDAVECVRLTQVKDLNNVGGGMEILDKRMH